MSPESAAQAAEPPVLVEKRGRLGHLILNRPRAINALNHDMVRTLQRVLDEWAHDDEVETVLLTGSGARGLCAGGDIVSIYRDARGGGSESVQFWRDEYRLNLTIADYPKPYVAIMDGIVLGGGIGLSAHGRFRVVTERSSVGLPETSIGFTPDVGGTWLLSHAPGETGTHLALTAGSVGAADAIAIGLADHLVPADRLPQLLQALENADARSAIDAASVAPGASALLADREWIDEAYSADDVEEILRRLLASPVPAAREAAATIASKSPIALAVTLASLRAARRLPDLAATLVQEFRASVHALRSHDLAEGIRAQVVDKDRTPHWRPANLADVDPSVVAAYFTEPAEGDLVLGSPAPHVTASTPRRIGKENA
ncbi:enoyl-CoA hydratase/isomerase family protein [Lacisediminihabitans profunda]|uniref:3-hydroxyisobutyryl-CoA hydrolase n=1 Tax=Lacisediminihabitans profunda TaxID=2594790 RepID=A0A5C8UMM4_9MICO|nr:enoyl-CoA hydratase/isomerase family protein [Lacisediminihabitans profunda]TXN28730.1 enoyl-CoA hydratase/isomerase family protein [Lacisediminihabitans profunda]